MLPDLEEAIILQIDPGNFDDGKKNISPVVFERRIPITTGEYIQLLDSKLNHFPNFDPVVYIDRHQIFHCVEIV